MGESIKQGHVRQILMRSRRLQPGHAAFLVYLRFRKLSFAVGLQARIRCHEYTWRGKWYAGSEVAVGNLQALLAKRRQIQYKVTIKATTLCETGRE